MVAVTQLQQYRLADLGRASIVLSDDPTVLPRQFVAWGTRQNEAATGVHGTVPFGRCRLQRKVPRRYEQSQMSGVGTRRSCREHRLAVSTFGLWREKFTGETRSMSPLAVKQDAAFVVIARLEGEPALTPSSA